MSGASGRYRSASSATTPCQLAPVCVKPWSRTSDSDIDPHHDRYRLPPAAAGAVRRAGAVRDAARLHLTGLALHADRAVAGGRATDHLLVAHRRALRRVLRARGGEGLGATGPRPRLPAIRGTASVRL